MTAEIAALQAYRTMLIKAGRTLEARAVEHCIKLVRASRQPVG